MESIHCLSSFVLICLICSYLDAFSSVKEFIFLHEVSINFNTKFSTFNYFRNNWINCLNVFNKLISLVIFRHIASKFYLLCLALGLMICTILSAQLS